MDHPLLAYAVLAFPLIALRDVGLAYFHLYAKLEPDPVRRAFQAFAQYAAVLAAWFAIWLPAQTVSAVLFATSNPIIPVLISTFLTLGINQWVLRKPVEWRSRPPLLSRNRAYDAFLRVVADHASQVKGTPEKRDDYLKRLYVDDRTRMQVISAYLHDHRDQRWIHLTPAQFAVHPYANRLRWTLIYLLALTPLIVPFALRVINPVMTEGNAALTTIAALIGTLLYGPLFDPASATLLFGLAAALLVSMGVGMEFDRLRPVVPGLAGLLILAILAVFVVHYVQGYVIARADTPLMRATDYLLVKMEQLEAPLRFFQRLVGGEAIGSVIELKTQLRAAVLRFQSIAGSLFILPAMLLWGYLSLRTIWEMHFSEAADVTFRRRMRKPEI